GGSVRVTQTGQAPLGPVRLTVEPAAPFVFSLQIRIPGWAKAWQLRLNGAPLDLTAENGVVAVARTWQSGDTLERNWETALRLIPAGTNGFAGDMAGGTEQAALRIGPMVLMLDPTLTIHAMFEWEQAEVLVPRSEAGAPFLCKLPAPILGRGRFEVPEMGY